MQTSTSKVLGYLICLVITQANFERNDTMTSVYQKYQKQSVTSHTAGEQLVLLLERAGVELAKAIDFINKSEITSAHNSIIHAENIFLYLIDSLDMSFPISRDLLSLYDFIIDRLTAANIKKDVSIIEEVRPLVAQLHETWKTAEHLSRNGK